jgi:hypothetical protein
MVATVAVAAQARFFSSRTAVSSFPHSLRHKFDEGCDLTENGLAFTGGFLFSAGAELAEGQQVYLKYKRHSSKAYQSASGAEQ